MSIRASFAAIATSHERTWSACRNVGRRRHATAQADCTGVLSQLEVAGHHDGDPGHRDPMLPDEARECLAVTACGSIHRLAREDRRVTHQVEHGGRPFRSAGPAEGSSRSISWRASTAGA
jgi:hypothetical protein